MPNPAGRCARRADARARSVDVFTRNDLVVRAELFGSFSDNSESYGGGLKVALPF
jgi:hypothetical protein